MKIAVFLHLVGVIVGLGAVITVDTAGLLWVFNQVVAEQLIWLSGVAQKLIWGAVIWQLVTGAYLLDLSTITWQTEIKLIAVAVLIINGVLLDQLRKSIAASKESNFWHLPKNLQLKSIILIGVSQLAWWTAVLIGFLRSSS